MFPIVLSSYVKPHWPLLRYRRARFHTTDELKWLLSIVESPLKPGLHQSSSFVCLDLFFFYSLCEKKNWYHSQLVLAMPQGYRAKDHVTLKSYSKSSQHQAVFDWVNANLASRISEVRSLKELREHWFHFRKKRGSEKIRVLLFSKMNIPPMFYSVLSVKFTGRVKFGIVDINSREGKEMASHLNLSEIPTYMVLTPEKNQTFGQGNGEYLNYQSMGLLLKMLHPEVNDIFLLSLIVINMACWLEFFIARGNLFKRLGRVLWAIVKWNFLLILLWLPVLGLFQLPYMDAIFDHLLTTLRVVGMTDFAGYVRSDWLWYSSVGWVFFTATFLLFSCGAAYLHYVYQGPEPLPSVETPSGFWNFQWESYLSNLFQPVANLARPTNTHAYSMELGMELLIERLAVPNLWLRPIISNQYIHELPVWKYQGPCADSDIGSDSECLSMRAESDCEESAASGSEMAAVGSQPREFGPKPFMFICEKCRMLQNNNANAKSEQELEEERMASESACAKYLMDGDYKCMCGQQGSGHGGHQETAANRSPQKDRSKSARAKMAAEHHQQQQQEAAQSTDPNHQMPPGIIAMMECSICLESYKYEAVLCGLPCGHAFHQQCIMGWLNRDNHHCPICRWPAYKAKPCNAHQHAD